MQQQTSELISRTFTDGSTITVTRTEINADVKHLVAEMVSTDRRSTNPAASLLDLYARTSRNHALLAAEEAARMLATYLLIEASTTLAPVATRNLHRLIGAYRLLTDQPSEGGGSPLRTPSRRTAGEVAPTRDGIKDFRGGA
jgi:hypothetical protein